MRILEFISDVAFPALALIISCVTFYFTNSMNKKVNKKDFEISENLKYEILRLIAALRSINAKSNLINSLPGRVNYNDEIKIINDLKLSPGFLLFLRAIRSDDERFWLDLHIQLLTINSSRMSDAEINSIAGKTLNYLKSSTTLKEVLDIEVFELIKEFCDIKGAVPNYVEQKQDSKDDAFIQFLTYLKKDLGISDPDINLFIGAATNDAKLVEQALNDGANQKGTHIDIINKYPVEFKKFMDTIK